VLDAIHSGLSLFVPQVDLQDKVLRVDVCVVDFAAGGGILDYEAYTGWWCYWAAVLVDRGDGVSVVT